MRTMCQLRRPDSLAYIHVTEPLWTKKSLLRASHTPFRKQNLNDIGGILQVRRECESLPNSRTILASLVREPL